MVRKKNQRTTTLTASEVLQRALVKIDTEGLESLSMRRLAQDLGVEAASLYNHVASKAALLDGVLGLVRWEMSLPQRWPDDWMDSLELILTEYLRVLNAHPNLMPLAGRRLDDGSGSGIVYLVEQQGFTLDDAVELWQSLVALVVGFATFTTGTAETGTVGLPDDIAARATDWRSETVRRSLRMIMEGYDEARTARRRSARSTQPSVRRK